MRRSIVLVIAAWSILGLVACAHPQARTQPERPALDVPEPPQRTIAPPPPEEPPAAAAPQPDPAAQKPIRPRPAQPKTEPPAASPSPPATQPAPTAPATPSTLQTTPPANQAEMVKTITGLLARAKRDLDGINKATLNADGKAQFDTARRFADQAEQALKDMNLVFALTLADKAATLARSLAGRIPDVATRA